MESQHTADEAINEIQYNEWNKNCQVQYQSQNRAMQSHSFFLFNEDLGL